MSNPLLDDRDLDFQLHAVLGAERLFGLPRFREHTRETAMMYVGSARKLARDKLLPSYRAIDRDPPRLVGGRVTLHPEMKGLFEATRDLGVIAATRPTEVGGQDLPLTYASAAMVYLMAGNGSVLGLLGLTTGAARLIESFGDESLKTRFLHKMYVGEWTGTMALTEPQAGSSLSDVTTRATLASDGGYRVRGSKIFISGGDHDLTENIVHLALARIVGAPAGIKGVSLFAIPRLREEGGALVDNDCTTAGMIHKIGWRGLPSIALELGDRDDCHGWLVGEPNRGISYMFQMMNEARLMVGLNGIATASVAYREALHYARERPQGRALGARDPAAPQVPILEHADVRRMLLRQKAIVEGGLLLLLRCALLSDLADAAEEEPARKLAARLLDLLTPVAKTFPAERGFEANALALQVHGGYGYSSEYLPEAWLRDQKLNSLHEGTTGIQGLDLLGRKVVAGAGQSLLDLRDEIMATIRSAREAGVSADECGRLEGAVAALMTVTTHLGGLGLEGKIEEMLRHSADYLEMFSVVVIGWQWLAQADAATRLLAGSAAKSNPDAAPEATTPEIEALCRGKLCAAQYWAATELPRVGTLAALCLRNDDSYARMQSDWF